MKLCNLTLLLTLTLVFLKPPPILPEDNFNLIQINPVGQPCRSNRECHRNLFCIMSSCRCPQNSIWCVNNQACLKCPPGWFEYGNKCFFISMFKTNWYNAKIACMKKKSHLLMVESDMVLDFSMEFFRQHHLSGSFYVGAKAETLHSNWTWLNGKSIPSYGYMWSECYAPSNTGGNSLKLSEGCATLTEYGLDDVNCLNFHKFICVLNEKNKMFDNKNNFYGKTNKLFWNSFERKKRSVIWKKCRYDYECPFSLICSNNTCKCNNGSVYSFELKRCMDETSFEDLDYLASGNGHDYYASKSGMTWFQAYRFSVEKNWNMLVLKDPILLLNFIDFLVKKNLHQPFWIGGIMVQDSLNWVDATQIEKEPWFRLFNNCGNKTQENDKELKCLVIEGFRVNLRECTLKFYFIIFNGNLTNMIQLTNFETTSSPSTVPMERLIINRTIIIRDILEISRINGLSLLKYFVGTIDVTEISELILKIFRENSDFDYEEGFWKSDEMHHNFTIIGYKIKERNYISENETIKNYNITEFLRSIKNKDQEIFNKIPTNLGIPKINLKVYEEIISRREIRPNQEKINVKECNTTTEISSEKCKIFEKIDENDRISTKSYFLTED
ncbi:C-type lectin domain family 9 member A, partial [Brachionus plicatilis]